MVLRAHETELLCKKPLTVGAASVESILPSFTLTEFTGMLSTHVECLHLLTTGLLCGEGAELKIYDDLLCSSMLFTMNFFQIFSVNPLAVCL